MSCPGTAQRLDSLVWTARVNTTGPWVEIFPSIQLQDVSIQIDHRELVNGCVAVWAINQKGDVLYRNGVTANCPQGKSWQHISTNTKFVSISVGCNRNVWGVGVDGAAYLRTEYQSSEELGKHWSRIGAPNHPLRTISIGKSTVWAVDEFGEHYYRESVTNTFPEGTQWIRNFGRIETVSVAANDEVWVKSRGSIEKCFNISPEQPTGRGWVLALPDCWRSITGRAEGFVEEEREEERDKASVKKQVFEPIKQSSYKDLMESGDIYSFSGEGVDFSISSSDSEEN